MKKDNQAETISNWEENVKLGLEYRKKYGDSDRWHTYQQYYRGYFPEYNSSTSGGILPYNITYAMARTLIPNLYFRNPYISITPRWRIGADRALLDIYAKVLQSTDNWLLQEMNVKKEMKTGLLDCFFTNRAIWKIGYDSQFGFSPDLTQAELGLADTTFTAFDRKGEAIEYNINVKPGMPWILRVDPEDIVVPFGVRTLDECAWIAHRVLRPLDDVKKDAKYSNTKDLKGTHMEKLLGGSNRANFYKELSKICDWVEIWEVRCRKKKEAFAFISGYNKFIRPPSNDVLQIEGLPFVDMTYNEDTKYYWGTSDVAIFEPQQLELNDARTQAMMHRRISLLKFLVNENIIDDTEIEKMMSADVGPCVKVKDAPAGHITTLQPHIPADLVGWTEHIRSDVRELIGFSRQAMGEIPAGRRTAREVTIATMAKEVRIDERRDNVADALTSMIRKVNQVIFDRWDGSHIVQIVGVDAARYWIEYTPKALRGEYTVKVDVESMTPVTKAMKKREIVELIGALGKYPGANMDYLMRTLLKEFDYLDVMQILPEAPETQRYPMDVNKFAGQQQQLLGSPKVLRERVGRAQQVVGAGL